MSSFNGRRHRNEVKTIRSLCGNLTVKGTASHIAAKWDELSSQSFMEDNKVLGEIYRQQAEHYRKPLDFSRESV